MRALDVIVALVTVNILFFLVSVLSKTFCCDEHTSVCLSKNKQKKKNKAKKTKEEQTRDKKKTQKKQDQRDHLIRKDLKVLSSEEGRAGHLISSLSVLKVVISSSDAQPVVCDRKEEKAEGERKRRRC